MRKKLKKIKKLTQELNLLLAKYEEDPGFAFPNAYEEAIEPQIDAILKLLDALDWLIMNDDD